MRYGNTHPTNTQSSYTVNCLFNILNPKGDRHFLDLLSKMGCLVDYQPGQVKVARGTELTSITIDMGDYPDIVQPLAIVSAYATGRTQIINIGHLRYKETNRLNNTAVELRKMGIKIDVTESTMSVNGGKPKGAT
ncbi:hypothetical protein ACFLVM_02135, partial [Chloroflexota bacterium]